MIPIYVINGFLESGKTEFIKFTLEQPYFKTKGTTLLLVCEEGEEAYDDVILKRMNTVLKFVEEETDFNSKNLLELEKKYHPDRIVVEYNGMWNYKNVRLPSHWKVEQQITNIDASTFPMYFNNMKSLLSEMIRKSELIIFNRCDGIEDLSLYKRNLKAINQKAEIVFEDSQGEIDEIFEEDLPYDLNASVIELNNDSYGIWYLDSLDHLERYLDKTVEFTGLVLKADSFPKNYFVPGRTAITCCADDMAFLGFACKYERADSLKDREWVRVRATVHLEYFEDYHEEGPVLHALKVEHTKPPKEEVISFV